MSNQIKKITSKSFYTYYSIHKFKHQLKHLIFKFKETALPSVSDYSGESSTKKSSHLGNMCYQSDHPPFNSVDLLGLEKSLEPTVYNCTTGITENRLKLNKSLSDVRFISLKSVSSESPIYKISIYNYKGLHSRQYI